MKITIPSNFGTQEISLETDPKLFSPGKPDEGTLAMLSEASLESGQTLLDLGCGCGIVAIWAAKQLGDVSVFMADIDPIAIAVASKNAQNNGLGNIKAYLSNGFANITITELDWILSNPPYHTDFSVAKSFIEKGFNRLKIGGKMVMVTKRELWYKNKFISIFGGVKIAKIGEYFVFTAQKRSLKYSNAKK